jgi:hypothetical protein
MLINLKKERTTSQRRPPSTGCAGVPAKSQGGERCTCGPTQDLTIDAETDPRSFAVIVEGRAAKVS